MNERSAENEQIQIENIEESSDANLEAESIEEISLEEDLSEAAAVFGAPPTNPSELAEMKTQIEQLQTRNDQLMRVAADFENYQRRVAREREDLIKFAGQQIVTNLLEVIDNIERALQNEVKPEEFSHFVEGVKMIHKQFLDVLQKSGVAVIDAVGQPFNPEYHEAIMSESTNDYPDETVIAEFQKGYQMNGRVLRPSMVKVSKED
ncbi:nucleotide exchange factor GrpE [bacterium (Candidatus Blackallbacteria) CG17_big_fil_post_rev_8_21_14_2_50_48_46]|uniref:Protein GrpE n=1 Tax=bacterium (Candidatus Blackallbacteria) CG17_big_fil_post_rev_8_21_14_2_50_48_46 TaxID=2014261 RepID=A0A2M7FYE8_9BACT|nr:MAG: nucleotide exchange factor GrpE [bacterium (Candidatus Blackallbacteria) CG18_big_fil_WC_8_21_14_2_50_49_26]PIW14357.1 MAG: nucleotide exchange factor GrpE [bacterium (Candidatus Blackallbacteria) CG17_big_fil_post_rev_8_21_14_2_50_48_46]PIW45626.1 MAG: nucleotide exchange factor GrpE [bacterium (Candidatus Blackallbacteria) CG13_big_fil_rev_8_21_14_2_50_49_14]